MNTTCTTHTILPGRLYSLAEALLGTPAHAESPRPWAPAVNVAEDDAAYEIAAELPGVAPADVRVVVRDGALTLQGERKDPVEGRKFHLVEHRGGSFRRSFALPKDADGGNVSAAFKNGVLTVTVPKLTEAKPREIEIKVN